MYDHYIAVDWAQTNMAIARLTKKSGKLNVIDVKSDIGDLRAYLKNLKGKKILTFEETTTSQWLYTETRELVDDVLVCDPYRNKLLSEGAKNDKIDASKLVKLLRSDLLKPVYHSTEDFIYLRRLVSGYENAINTYVRTYNQRAALLRGLGKTRSETSIDEPKEQFVLESFDFQLDLLKSERKKYESEFESLTKEYRTLRNLATLPGIRSINAVKLAARIVNIQRFPTVQHFWSYCGLIKFEKMSGGRSYGKRTPRFCRPMKDLICSAVTSATREVCTNPLRERYVYLIKEKNYGEREAIVKTRRYLASLIYGVMKNNKKFDLKKARSYKN